MGVSANIMKEAMLQEVDRLDFLINRDGFDGALRFAGITLKTYRRVVIYRREHGIADHRNRHVFIASYLVFKYFVKNQNLNIM